MSKRVIIEHTQFREWLTMKPYASTQRDKHEIKNKLLNDMRVFYADKWDRLKRETKDCLDFICYSAASRGFCYASQQYLSLNFNVSQSTVRRIMRELSQGGLIKIAYRRNGSLNCPKKPVYFLVNHPAYGRYASLFAHDDRVDGIIDDRTETTKNVDTAPEETLNQVSNLSNNLNNNLNNCINRSIDDPREIPDCVPHDFAKLYSYYHPVDVKKIYNLWSVAKIHINKHNVDNADYGEIACHALFQTVGQLKIGRKIKNKIGYFAKICENLSEQTYYDELNVLADPQSNLDNPPTQRVSGDDLYSSVQSRTSAWLYS